VKILHFISSGGLFGAENVLLTIAAGINDHGWISVVGAIRDGRQEHLEIIEKAKAWGIPTVVFESGGKFDLQTISQLKKYLCEQKIQILHTHNYKSDILGAVAARWAGIPAVATAHGFTDMNRAVSGYERLDRFVLRSFFKKVIVVTDKMLPNFSRKKKMLISNGINIQRFAWGEQKRAEFRSRYKIAATDFVIGTVGRLSPEKNQMLLLQAAEHMCAAHPQLKFLLVGNGPEEKKLKDFVKEKGLTDKIIFTGLLPDSSAVYPGMDIFTLTSLTEGVPLTILEAMAAHVPVVATKVGGVADIIQDGVTGLLVRPGSVEILISQFQLLLSSSEERHALSQRAFAFVKENFSQERMVERYKAMYQEVAAP